MQTPAFNGIGLSRITAAALATAVLPALVSCGGSAATTMTSPTSITRWAITMQWLDGPLPAEGATASISVTAARECAWSASTEGPWLSIRTGVTGQGDGTVEFFAAANPDPQLRRGAITANGQRAEITQAAGTCDITLAQSAASFNQGGGSGQVQVRASSSMCPWSCAGSVGSLPLCVGAPARRVRVGVRSRICLDLHALQCIPEMRGGQISILYGVRNQADPGPHRMGKFEI